MASGDHDPIAYFKWLKLGDFLVGPAEPAISLDKTEFKSAGWGQGRTAVARGGGTTHMASLRSGLIRGHNGTETFSAFFKRKLALLNNAKTVAGFGSSYSQAGDLAVIEDADTDVAAAYSSVTGGSNTTIRLTETPALGLVVGDYIIITDGATKSDVAIVEIVDNTVIPGQGPLITVDLDYSYDAGAIVAKLQFTLPSAFLQNVPRIPGAEPGTNQAALNLDWEFESADAPLYKS